MDRTDVLHSLQTLVSEGEAPTADRLATHIGLTFHDAEPPSIEIETALDALVVEGTVRRLRVFANDRRVETRSDWIIVFLPI